MNIFKRILCLALSAIIFLSYGTFAQTAAEKKKEMQKKIDQADKQYSAAEDKKLYYDGLADELSDDIKYYNGVISSLDGEITDCNNKIEETEKKLSDKQEGFNERLRALQESGSLTYIDVIFGAKSFSDFLLRLTLVGDIVDHDKNIINEIADLKTQIVSEKTAIEDKKTQQQSAREIVVSQQQQYQVLSDKQNSMMNELKKDKAKYTQEYEKAVKQMKEEEEKARAAVAPNPSYKVKSNGGAAPAGGSMHWPLAVGASITCPFGYRTDPAPSNHTGIDLSAGGIYGANILAANSGTVTRVVNGSYGYGKYVIINHGDGTATLYGHASRIFVTQGQQVQRGQAIAAVGNTGWSTGPHLHFEVIVNGKKVNPVPYIY